ncbi:MAG TPA: haloacid dehalogenase type II [Alphaproteobacteria bacterium]|nr:haloacid dehalogenase type II [Alphaproteobacteria bacterium]
MSDTKESLLQDIDACVFDAYGTLFDTGSAAARCKEALGADWTTVSDLWRRKQLEYSWLRSLMGRHADFWHVTGESLDYALALAKRTDPVLRAMLMQQYLSLDPYPEAEEALRRLKAKGMKTAVLSNGTPTMLTAAVNSSGLSALIDAALSVEAVGIYKPHPSVYQVAVDKLGVAAARICFLSSNGWDAAGAAAFGFRVVWVNRNGAPTENLPAMPERQITSLAQLPALLGLS